MIYAQCWIAFNVVVMFAQVATTTGVDAGGGRGGEHRARAARAGGGARVALPAARRGGARGACAVRVRAAPARRAPLRRPPRVHRKPRCGARHPGLVLTCLLLGSGSGPGPHAIAST